MALVGTTPLVELRRLMMQRLVRMRVLAHLVLQLMEKGSLLRRLAQGQGKTSAVALFSSLKNRALRLMESLRNLAWPKEAFTRGRIQIRFDSS